jgi:hypothetical protein
VRDSKVVDRIRKLIPHQGDDVSPFERPLTTSELSGFAGGFSQFVSKSFRLPFVSVAEIVPFLRWLRVPCYRLSRRLLGAFPFLDRFATVKVIKLIK